ncbi:DUF3341 domain-containing protein [Candidatus Marinamargulisbacteria bacterium SCGC AG-410-N11]|nr:DUF3341 domain-containing protein [Candidatus Marinamargulisbacteria bacterium SCGC AG-410-N11]
MSENCFGILAEFKSPHDLLSAAEKLRGKGYKNFDAYSPFPIHGMDEATGIKPSILGWIVLVGGALGLSAGFGLQTWVSTSAYKIIVSGKPLFSYQAFVPVTFELMVLFAAFFTVFGMFALNKLPMHYHPLLKSKNFESVTSHGYFIAIESSDPQFNSAENVLIEVGGSNIEKIEE